jgi:hypothetical protein
MRRYPFVLALVAFSGIGANPARAQLVHITLTSFGLDSQGILSSLDPAATWNPWQLQGPVTLDIYYDPSELSASIGFEGGTVFTGVPSNNFWTLTFAGPPPRPTFVIDRPLVLEPELNGFSINYQSGPDPSEDQFNTLVNFDTPSPLTSASLPIPPFGVLAGDSTLSLTADEGLLGLPEAQGFLFGSWDTYSVAIVPDFEPVPEPSTYGIGALGVMLAAVGLRRMRLSRI